MVLKESFWNPDWSGASTVQERAYFFKKNTDFIEKQFIYKNVLV